MGDINNFITVRRIMGVMFWGILYNERFFQVGSLMEAGIETN
jgi:hypothetical protein